MLSQDHAVTLKALAAACPELREGTDIDAIGDVVPGFVAWP